MTDDWDTYCVQLAVDLSGKSSEPVGCGTVLAQPGLLISVAWNSQRADRLAIYHAEIKALITANMKLGSRHLPEGTTAYSSCEPCAMCLTALSLAKVARIVYFNRMIDLFPNDPQSQLDSAAFVRGLNHVPALSRST